MPALSLETFSFPSYLLSPPAWEDFQTGLRREWLVTNGAGGFASSTIIGANTRSYHGLLAASFPHPAERQILLSKVEEEVVVGETTYQLSANQYRDKVHPTGFTHLALFSQNPFPSWTYNLPGAILKKWVFMRHGENTTIVGYELLEADNPVELYLLVLASKRNIHHVLRADLKKFEQSWEGNNAVLSTAGGEPFLYLGASRGEFFKNGNWYYNFQYIREKERGLDFEEDLFHPGTFSVKLAPGQKVFLVASTSPVAVFEAEKWEKEEEARLREIAASTVSPDPEVRKLALAADAFLVKEPRAGSSERVWKGPQEVRSIMAGYPWFGDWGRDAFISLPGLLLVTGRAQEAEGFLLERAAAIHDGFLPTFFSDSNGSQTAYESADTSLWFIYASYKTWKYSRSNSFLRRIFPSLVSILDACKIGRKPWIKMREDGLLHCEHADLPLTWMDAKVGYWVVTPRGGAPVEVNALWYNALKMMEEFSAVPDIPQIAAEYGKLAPKVQFSFLEKFWNKNQEALYDVVGTNVPDSSVRPNQLFAISLPYSLLPREKEEKVFKLVSSRLYTPFGLRTLDPQDKSYKGTYQGDRWLRDGAYHQGTVWPWLLGPFMTALVRVEGEKARPKVLQLLSPVLSHLMDAGIGFLSEIFWGDFPHQPVGCIAQAWSVAEVLRAYVEEGLGIAP